MAPDQTARDGQVELGSDEEGLAGPEGHGRVAKLVERELGPVAAEQMVEVWRAFDDWESRTRPGEGLRERKKRQTRQRISDVATAMFVARGFDNVRIAEIADAVGVSEKTIYNYFQTKESLVFDMADEQVERLTAAVRERAHGQSPMSAFVTALKAETARFSDAVGNNRIAFIPAFAEFAEMINATPALRAAWGEHRQQLVDALAAVMADDFGVDPRDPEPMVASRALVSLLELLHNSQLRRVSRETTGAQLKAAIDEDLDRAARLLDTGLWSLHLMTAGGRINKEQLREAAQSAEQARQQVVKAVREAKRVWRALRAEHASHQSAHQERQAARAQRGYHAASPSEGGERNST